MEADIVSSRIAALLGEKTFQFSPAEWQEIHRRLFDGVFDGAGKIRPYNITQKELALKVGKSERTIKKRTVELQEKGYIRRLNGKRNGRWEVLSEFMQ